MKQSEFKGLDKKVEKIYGYGCYFLDLLFLAKGIEPEIEEIMHYYDLFVKNEWMEDNCYIKNPCAILKHLTGKTFNVKKSDVFDRDADYIIGCYYNPTANLNHFVVMSKDDKVLWDSIENSITVRDGIRTSYRLFYEC